LKGVRRWMPFELSGSSIYQKAGKLACGGGRMLYGHAGNVFRFSCQPSGGASPAFGVGSVPPRWLNCPSLRQTLRQALR
jgi:hypothetical protein